MKRQGFVMGSVILIATVFLTKVLGLIYRIPLANMLGGTGMAYFSSAHSVFMPIYAVAVSGISPAIAKMVSGSIALGNYRDAVRLRHCALSFFMLTGIAFTLLLVLLSDYICVHIISEPLSRISVVAIAPCVAIGAVMSVERGYTEGMRNMVPTAISEIIEAVIKLSCGLWFAFLASARTEDEFARLGTVFGKLCENEEIAHAEALPYIAGASVLGITLANLCSLIYAHLSARFSSSGISREMLSYSQTDTPKKELLKKAISLAVPFAVTAVISTLSGLIDLVTVNRCLEKAVEGGLSAKSLGIDAKYDSAGLESFIYGSYSGLALTVSGIVPSLTAMFGRSILPLVSSAQATGDREKLRKSIFSVILLALSISMPCGLGIAVFSDEILRFLFAGRIAEIAVAKRVLAILGISSIPISLVSPLFCVLQGIGNGKAPIRITLVGSAVKLIMNMMLVQNPSLNIAGAGISTFVCYTLMLILSVMSLHKICGRKITDRRLIIGLVISSLLCCEGAYLMNAILTNCLSMRFSLVLSVLFSVNIYIYSLYILSVLPKYGLKRYFSR